MRKIYYQLQFWQTAPLRIGAGDGELTDLDVLRDSRGLPFLPGSAIAGVLRSMFPETEAKRLLGDLNAPNDGGGTAAQESLVQIYDAVLPANANVTVQHRDGVGINDRGTAIPGAKYDFEAVDMVSEVPYTGILELTDNVPADLETALDTALGRWARYGAQFGARTTRGYGSMEVEVLKKTITSLSDWLAFDPLAEDAFSDAELLEANKMDGTDRELHIHADLCMKGSFSVRTSNDVSGAEGKENTPTLVPLMNANGKPVIPGTSWAGVFRHHMLDLARDLNLDTEPVHDLFGSTGANMQRSRIRFSETAIEESKEYVYTRNAIDRYTGAPRNQALFTERFAWGGTGSLNIELPANTDETLLRLLSVCLIDLHLGLLNAGGEGGVGRGICEIKHLTRNGIDITGKLTANDASLLLRGGE